MKFFFAVICSLFAGSAIGQFGVSFHQSNLPFVGFNYEIADKFMPELRLGMDTYLDNISVEAVATYQFINKEDVEVYAGLGGRVNVEPGLVAPVGLHIFPFSSKNFGFHAEVCPIILSEDTPIVRGSWGIRYRFRR